MHEEAIDDFQHLLKMDETCITLEMYFKDSMDFALKRCNFYGITYDKLGVE